MITSRDVAGRGRQMNQLDADEVLARDRRCADGEPVEEQPNRAARPVPHPVREFDASSPDWRQTQAAGGPARGSGG